MGALEVTLKGQGRDEGGGQNFRVADPKWRVFPGLERFQQIVTKQ